MTKPKSKQGKTQKNGAEGGRAMEANERKTAVSDKETLTFHFQEVLQGNRRFENATQSVSRMISEHGVKKFTRGGRTVYDYPFFRQGRKHTVGWFNEINELVNFVREAARGGPPTEQAFVLVGEPGNGKTFFAQDLCDRYREFLTRPGNRRYTFRFFNLNKLHTRVVNEEEVEPGKFEERVTIVPTYGKITEIESQTFEDPMILAMNLCETQDENKKRLADAGFDDARIDALYRNYRPLGACTEYIWNDIREYCDGDIEKMLKFVRIVPVRIADSQGSVTGKYSAGDKITTSKTDLLGEEALRGELHLADPANPYKYNVRKGALARVGGGGIHFSDELFRNKTDLVQVYLQVIQNRTIELDGYKWPIDVLIIATSNNDVYNEFVREGKEAPIKDRCTVCYVSHNTDYRLQRELTDYVLGEGNKVTVTDETMHEDPNLNYALSVLAALTRLPHSDKLTPVETMKLEAGEIAGEKSVRTLLEVKEVLNASKDVTKRWGQRGIGHRGLGRIAQRMLDMPETHEGKCRFARDAFKAAEREILDYVAEAVDREKFMKDVRVARELYRKHIKTSVFNAYMDDPDAIRKEVMAYVNMIIGIDDDRLGPDKVWRYRDPQSGEYKPIKIDERFIESVETRLKITSQEMRDAFRTNIRKTYGQRISTDPAYDFMDNKDLVEAVTDVRLESDVAGASSLVGALSNQTNEENMRVYNRMIDTMLNKLGYCKTCAEKTIEYFCEKVDES